MSFPQHREVCFNQESLLMTYHNVCHKSLVRTKSKSPNWQGPQPISYKANLHLIYSLNNLKWQTFTLQLTWVIFLTELLFWFYPKKSQVTYQNFHNKSLVRPNSNSPIFRRSQPISYITNSPRRNIIYQLGHRCIVNIWGKGRSDIKLYFNHSWLKLNGQNNYICYICSKFYFSQSFGNWKDYVIDIVYLCRYRLFWYLRFWIFS